MGSGRPRCAAASSSLRQNSAVRPGWRRAVGGALVVLVLLAAVAAGAAAGGGAGASPPSPARVYQALADAATVLLVALGVLTFAVLAWVLWSPPRAGRTPQGRPFMLRTLLFAAVLVAVAARVRLQALQRQTAAGALGHRGHAAGGAAGLLPEDVAGYAAGLVLLAVLAVLGWWRWRRTRPTSPPRPEEVLESVDAAVAELASARDPREAVVRAYAVMERAFANRGLGRRRPEAPAEYLERLLAAYPATGAACRSLTSLYHHARFSHHGVGDEMRTAAERELQSIRLVMKSV